jgi:hypothetical protein
MMIEALTPRYLEAPKLPIKQNYTSFNSIFTVTRVLLPIQKRVQFLAWTKLILLNSQNW